jgi:hypothetical protein
VQYAEMKMWSKARGLSAHVSDTGETDYADSLSVVDQSTTP